MSDRGESIWQTRYIALAFLLSLLLLRIALEGAVRWLLRKTRIE